jgi:hypothetical protein
MRIKFGRRISFTFEALLDRLFPTAFGDKKGLPDSARITAIEVDYVLQTVTLHLEVAPGDKEKGPFPFIECHEQQRFPEVTLEQWL